MASSEELLISAILNTGDFSTANGHGLTPDFFVGFKSEYKWLLAYASKHRKTPGKATFKKKFEDFRFYKVDDVEHLVLEVIKDHSRRVMMDAMDASLSSISEGDFDTATKDLSATLTKVMSQLEGASESYEAGENWKDTFDTVQRRVELVKETGLAGVPSGWPTLDNATGGFQPGWSTIVAARLGQGKTWTMIKMAWEAVLAGDDALYFTMEQSRHQIGMRFHSLASRSLTGDAFDSRALMKGKGFNIGSYREFLESLDDSVEGKFYIRDTTRGRVTPLTVRAAIEEHQPAIVFIDYLTLMAKSRDWQEVADISSQIKMIAEQYEIPIVSAAQLNRTGAGGGKDPGGTETIGGSDAIGQDADLVIALQQLSKSVMRLKTTKFRHGDTGDIWDCEFRPGNGVFDEVSPSVSDNLQSKDLEVD